MLLKQTLREIVKTQAASLVKLNLGTKREALDSINPKLPFAIVLSGVRRGGKSTLLHQLMKKTKSSYYFNFEDSRAAGFELGDFEALDEIMKEEFGENDVYFFDEIQNVNKWELFVRTRLDRGEHFIITGSNASLLSAELGTRLTGRHLRIELFPFSYAEFLAFSRLQAGKASFGQYLREGGFPQYLQAGLADILRELLRNILLRDIALRHQIRNVKTLSEMAVFLLSNVGKDFSYNSLAKTFSLGSANTAMDWVSFFEDSYLLFSLPKFDYSLKKQAVNPRKIYAIDNGMVAANSASFTADEGRMLENSVFLHLRRKYGAGGIFYFREKGECDFVVREKNKITKAVQVCLELHENDKAREIGGLMEAMGKFSLSQGLIITLGQEERLKVGGKTIKLIPAWKWMQEKAQGQANQ